MRYRLIALCMLACSLTPAVAQLSINFGSPGVRIGINLGGYPTLQRVPGYPVYYAPGVNSNYFFYDGLYWVYEGDNWYASSWYNGPWSLVDQYDVPVYLLRVPVRYYRHAPRYFRSWRSDDAPRWGEHWGPAWEKRRSGWDQWNRSSAPAPAPLPTYQRQYSGSRYPQGAQQAVIETQNYRYQPRDPVAQQNFTQRRAQAQSAQPAPAPQQQQAPRQQTQQVEQRQQQGNPAARGDRQQQQQAPRQQTQQVEQRAAPPPERAQRQPQQQPQQQQQQQQQAPRQQPQQAEQRQQQQANPAARGDRQPQQQQQQQAPRQQPQQAEQKPQQNAPQGRGDNKGQGRGEKDNNNKDGKDNKER